MRIGGFGTLAFLALLLVTLQGVAAANTCTQLFPHGPESDRDCDGVIDSFDNCADVRNPDQSDADRNGLGDACDKLVTYVLMQPDSHLQQGEFGHLAVRVVNNRDEPLRDVTVAVRNSALDIDTQQSVSDVPVGGVVNLEFWLAIPKCASPRDYPLSLSFTQRAASGAVATIQSESHTITVERGNTCGTPASVLDTTIIHMVDRQDIDRGDRLLSPITIMNLGPEQATYALGVEGVDFGTWRIDPATDLTLASGESRTVYLYLGTDAQADPGTHRISLRVSSDGKRTNVPLTVFLRGPIERATQPMIGKLIVWGLLIPLVVLVLAGMILLAIIRARTKERKIKSETVQATAPKKPKKTVSVEDAENDKDRFETHY